MDSPSHMIEEGRSLDSYSVDKFVGKALIVDVTKHTGQIEKIVFDSLSDKLDSIDFVILKTGWDAYWGSDGYFENYPVLSKEATEYLVGKNLKGIGMDCISVDTMDTKTFENHHIIFSKDMVIIENLRNLDRITTDVVDFFALPLKYKDADGAPIRAICHL